MDSPIVPPLNRYVAYDTDRIVRETSSTYAATLLNSLDEIHSNILNALKGFGVTESSLYLATSLIKSLPTPTPPTPSYKLIEEERDALVHDIDELQNARKQKGNIKKYKHRQ